MDGFQVIYTIFVTVLAYADFCGADREYMVSKAESIIVSVNYETTLECEMNIQPDNFQWKFYPLDKKDVYDPKAHISLTSAAYQFVERSSYTNNLEKKTSSLTLVAKSTDVAGDYQCLAHYGASVVASIPWRVTIIKSPEFPMQQKTSATVVAGNSINWRCEAPRVANPDATIEYLRGSDYFRPVVPMSTKSLIIPNVTRENSGDYKCIARNIEETKTSDVMFSLKVVKSGAFEAPRFLVKPKSLYNVTKGSKVFLECAAVGYPIPEFVWKKRNGIISEHRSQMTKEGLVIENVSLDDDGVYECIQKNNKGTISHLITLHYNELPSIDCDLDKTDITQGEPLDLECSVKGTPKPEITWFLNGFVVTNDSKIETFGNRIKFEPAEKRHAGNLQIFARNVVGTVYRTILITVIPLSTTQENITDFPPANRGNHKQKNLRKIPKHGKLIPPSKPIVSRISDEAVLLRWTVQSKGLPIQFFKVQYKDLGPLEQHGRKASKWMTTNADIPPEIRSFEVPNLKPDHYYKFRIAAVYSNNDNTNSHTSEKFLLRRMDFDNRNTLPVPIITGAEPINSTSVKIYWRYDASSNITVEGFFVNYLSASRAADYMKATVDGASTDTYVLTHLQPDTVYDIKLQSFTSKSASNFSHIKKVKTLGMASSTTVSSTLPPSDNTASAGISKMYIIVAPAVLGVCAILGASIALLIFCRKFKQKKNNSRGDRDKPGVDEHRIQADGNEYVVGPKNATRPNGCVPSNRITITSNPLADADNKNQNMIEMSSLSTQNNNCQRPSVSGEDSPRDKKNKNREKRIRNKNNLETNSSGENYV